MQALCCHFLANQVNRKENQAIPWPNEISKPESDLEAQIHLKVENVKLKTIKNILWNWLV